MRDASENECTPCRFFWIGPVVNEAAPISRSRQLVGLAGWLLLTFAVAGLGAIASGGARAFYAELVRPSWAPPGWLFGPVWSALYALMGVSAWLVWRTRAGTGTRTALFLFVIQLAANALWSWLFFVWHQGALAFADVLLLWLLILATIVAFRRFSGLAAALLWPYLAWVTFASALTFAVWRRNPGLLA
jgi:tryptophan-rich sensory protein